MRLTWVLVTIFLFAAGVRGVVWWQAAGDPAFGALNGDARRYDEWARDIAAGDWLSRREGVFYQAPLYPYLLAVHRLVFGEAAMSAVRVTQVILGSAGCVLLALATGKLAGRPAAALAGLLLAIQPAAVFFDVQIEKSAVDGFLMCSILLAIVCLHDRPRWWHAPLAGGLVGLMTLSRENAVVLLAVVLPVAWMAGRRVERWPVRVEHWLFPVMAAAAFLVIVLPVSVRNWAVGGELHLTTCQFGPNFFIGNGAPADGVYRPLREGRGDPAFERADATELAEAATGRPLSPREVSRYWTRRTIGDIAKSPLRWAGLVGRKWAMAFHRAEIADNNDIDSLTVVAPLLRVADLLLHMGVLAVLLPLAIAARWDDRGRLWPVWGVIGLLSVSVALFYVFARYRYPMIPPMVLAIAVGLPNVAPLWRSGRWRPVAVGGALSILAAAGQVWAVVPERARGVGYYNHALKWDRRGHAFRAAQWYERALQVNPNLAEAHNNLGLIEAQGSGYPAAIRHFREVLRLRPDDAAAHNNLGMALGGSGDTAGAVAAFETALRLDPSLSAARENLEKARALLETAPDRRE